MRPFVVVQIATPDEPTNPETISLEEMSIRYVLATLAACGGNKSAAARALKIDRRSLYRWLAKGTQR